jgi:predicted Rossmann fold flavoprotein
MLKVEIVLGNDEKIKEEYGELQFTDYGVSGICVFNLSRYVSYMNKGKLTIKINLMPFLKEDANKYLENRSDNISIYDMLKRIINEKIVRVILDELKINYDINYVSLDKNKKESLIEYLTCFTLNVTGTKSFDNSQVTAGGIPLSEININTFESKIVNNLFLLGELLDVDGDCGGYNISFAILSSLISSEYIRGKND